MITSNHHRKAAKLNISLTEHEDLSVTATHRPTGLTLLCTSSADAFKQVAAAEFIKKSYAVAVDERVRDMVHVKRRDGKVLKDAPMKPVAAMKAVENENNWVTEAEAMRSGDINEERVQSNKTPPKTKMSIEVQRSDSGVALDGTVAFKEGTPAADNPFIPKTDDVEETDEMRAAAEQWDEDWDAAADKATPKGGSVVSDRYRTRYAEAGHPTHCGDWLAETLNNAVLNKKGTDLELFEAICSGNGVDMGGYKRDGKGWEGRFRMTGRNLLAKKVYLAGGVLKMPDGNEYKAPKDWMEMQRYKMPKSEQGKPVPTAA